MCHGGGPCLGAILAGQSRWLGRSSTFGANTGVLASLGHSLLGGGDVHIGDEQGHHIVEGGHPTLGCRRAMRQARSDVIAGKVVHSRLQVDIVEGAVAIRASRDGTLERVEGILPFLGAAHGQPGNRVVAVRGAHS